MILIIDAYCQTIDLIVDLVSEHAPYKVLKIDQVQEADVRAARGVILGCSNGLPPHINRDAELQRTHFLTKGLRPTLGICFGHQWLAVQFGAKIWEDEPIHRPETIILLEPNALFAGFPPTEVMRQHHRKYVGLPMGFRHLAVSDSCYNEAMQHPQLPIWGVQFHPETSGQPGALLLRNFLRHAYPNIS